MFYEGKDTFFFEYPKDESAEGVPASTQGVLTLDASFV